MVIVVVVVVVVLLVVVVRPAVWSNEAVRLVVPLFYMQFFNGLVHHYVTR